MIHFSSNLSCMLQSIREETAKIIEEAQMEMDINTELTELRNEASFLRKENFDLKEKIQDLEEKVRDLNRVVASIQPSSDEIQAIEDEIEAELQDELELPKEKRWIAFAPTSYHQLRVGAELKFTRGRHVMTGVVKWIGQRPQGSNKTFIGVEAAEEVMDPDSCGDLWECGNSPRSILLTMDKIIVAWDWDSIISKL